MGGVLVSHLGCHFWLHFFLRIDKLAVGGQTRHINVKIVVECETKNLNFTIKYYAFFLIFMRHIVLKNVEKNNQYVEPNVFC